MEQEKEEKRELWLCEWVSGKRRSVCVKKRRKIINNFYVEPSLEPRFHFLHEKKSCFIADSHITWCPRDDKMCSWIFIEFHFIGCVFLFLTLIFGRWKKWKFHKKKRWRFFFHKKGCPLSYSYHPHRTQQRKCVKVRNEFFTIFRLLFLSHTFDRS